MSRPGRAGLASLPLGEQRDRVLASWDGFLAAAADVDLDRPSRLPGWSGHDVLVHVGDWAGVTTLDTLLAEARSGTVAPPYDVDAINAEVVAAHRDVPNADVLAAVRRCRDRMAEWFAAPDAADGPSALGLTPVMSSVGVLPLLTVVNASGYELAVHTLDLGVRPDDGLLDAGLAALVDVTGVFAHRRGLRSALTAWTGRSGWQVRTERDGWVTAAVRERPPGAAVEGDAAVLLDTSAGRRAVPALLASRTMRVHGLADIVRLAPIVEEVPGLPGGPALRAAARWV
ncbi:MAG TPA: maleylpyruvate isomerase N-terminal domain-containing protein, partial [Actinophytocola sp.]|uniref:maleylpyruvate isomerase N-terminal domain-containing protein n=1 Tax=Actinophytocola sp. TaxID=1872138 RepID=UPI002F923A85